MYIKIFFGKKYQFYSRDDVYKASVWAYTSSDSEDFEENLSIAGVFFS